MHSAKRGGGVRCAASEQRSMNIYAPPPTASKRCTRACAAGACMQTCILVHIILTRGGGRAAALQAAQSSDRSLLTKSPQAAAQACNLQASS